MEEMFKTFDTLKNIYKKICFCDNRLLAITISLLAFSTSPSMNSQSEWSFQKGEYEFQTKKV
jgi:hypothetical protein